MGYYNDVAICLKKVNFDELQTRITEAVNNGKVDYDLLKQANIIISQEGQYVVIKWGWIKWNESWSEIAIIENYLNELDENFIPFSFIRVGEADGDIETRFNGGKDGSYECNRISVNTTIEIDD